MNKILMSIQPHHLAKILNGEKTIEIRKTFPKDLPVEVYGYCTLGSPYLSKKWITIDAKNWEWKLYRDKRMPYDKILNGLVPCKFTVRKVDKWKHQFMSDSNVTDEDIYWIPIGDFEKSCMSVNNLADYGNHKDLYALHISNLEIFDKPMELKDFYTTIIPKSKLRKNEYVDYKTLTRAPQSWQYVEVKK